MRTDPKQIVPSANDGDTLQTIAGVAAWNRAFGADAQEAESLAQSTTSSATYQDKVTLTTPALTGTYWVWFTCAFGSAGGNGKTNVRAINTTDSVTFLELNDQVAMNTTGPIENRGFAAQAEVVFSGVAKTFKIQFAAASSTAQIANARIFLCRKSA